MDLKGLAKSKRAHSLHHSKKHHPHSPAKASPVVSSDKKQTGKQVKEKPQPVRESRPLPSNWDRYDDASSLASEETQSSSAPPPEFVAPKSKGADYAYILSEAKEAQAHKASGSHPFADDITYDFGPMLVSRGQSILSYVEDDNFELDCEGSSTFQIPFLSLNLDALAKQLARTKPSIRWFIEPGVIPTELLDDKLQAGIEDKHDVETLQNNAVKQDPGSPSVDFSPNGDNSQFRSSSDGTSKKQITVDDYMVALNSGPQQMEYNTPVRTFGFEAASAEAELDVLLNSFSETKILDSSMTEATGIVPKLSETTKIRSTRTFPDADIDKLLEETSGLTTREVNASSSSSGLPSSSGSKSQLLEDFDSWLDSI